MQPTYLYGQSVSFPFERHTEKNENKVEYSKHCTSDTDRKYMGSYWNNDNFCTVCAFICYNAALAGKCYTFTGSLVSFQRGYVPCGTEKSNFV